MMTFFVVINVLAAFVGIGLLVTGIRRGPDAAPRNMVMLIGRMMLTAFGIIIASFSIVYSLTAPLDPNTGAAR